MKVGCGEAGGGGGGAASERSQRQKRARCACDTERGRPQPEGVSEQVGIKGGAGSRGQCSNGRSLPGRRAAWGEGGGAGCRGCCVAVRQCGAGGRRAVRPAEGGSGPTARRRRGALLLRYKARHADPGDATRTPRGPSRTHEDLGHSRAEAQRRCAHGKGAGDLTQCTQGQGAYNRQHRSGRRPEQTGQATRHTQRGDCERRGRIEHCRCWNDHPKGRK